ncbi:MAG TPA: hypothetical protein VHZ53_00185 [Steroidobacteraceae bacterium]|nr:hypothetical protein [Steroidobacteraceae bacterium]
MPDHAALAVVDKHIDVDPGAVHQLDQRRGMPEREPAVGVAPDAELLHVVADDEGGACRKPLQQGRDIDRFGIDADVDVDVMCQKSTLPDQPEERP